MITTIIKRDGTKQQFKPEKLNGWGEWAAKKLGKYVNWPEIVLHVASTADEEISSVDLQKQLISACLVKNTWSYNVMAGRLFAAMHSKDCYGKHKPHIRDLHLSMIRANILDENFFNQYTKEEYDTINSWLNHKLDLTYAYYQHTQIRDKYALKDRVNGIDYETPQYVFMRVAMRLAANLQNKMERVEKFYYYFSNNKINVPTPYYTNSGTDKNGFLSCCVYTTNDTAPSLAAGDHIAYMMTVNSSGIGAHIHTRAIGSPVRGGIIKHQGKFPYYKALAGAIMANMQNGRGGAATVTYSVYDPQVLDIQKLKNPRSPDAKRNRDLDYAMSFNKFFAVRAAKNLPYHTFDPAVVPELYEAITAKDETEFERLYEKAVAEGKFVEEHDAREVLLEALKEAVGTGRHYLTNLSEMNRHTPFKDNILQSNLCQEIAIFSRGYNSVKELYEEKESGEVGMCALAGIVVSNIESDEEYADAAYHSLLMIDVAINETDYPLPQIGWTAKKRMSAAVGIVGLAHYMAKHKKSYQTQQGRDFMHELSETHYWHLLNASLRLGKELGNAEWIDRTEWPNGWLPIDTYNKTIDSEITVSLKRDWEALRKAIIANKGIRNSVLVAHAPTESSSIAAGTTNGLYPIRQIALLKSSGNTSTTFVVPDSEQLEYFYENAYQVPSIDIIRMYAIFQKFTDQAISADMWVDVSGNNRLSSKQLLQDFFNLVKYGVKTRYYVNNKVGTSASMDAEDCEACKL